MLKDNMLQRDLQQVLSQTKESKTQMLIGYLECLVERKASVEESLLLSKEGYFCNGHVLYCKEEKSRLTIKEVLNIVFEVCMSRVNYTHGLTANEHIRVYNYVLGKLMEAELYVSTQDRGDYRCYLNKQLDGWLTQSPEVTRAREQYRESKLSRTLYKSIGEGQPFRLRSIHKTQEIAEITWEYPGIELPVQGNETGVTMVFHNKLRCVTKYYDRATGEELDQKKYRL